MKTDPKTYKSSESFTASNEISRIRRFKQKALWSAKFCLYMVGGTVINDPTLCFVWFCLCYRHCIKTKYTEAKIVCRPGIYIKNLFNDTKHTHRKVVCSLHSRPNVSTLKPGVFIRDERNADSYVSEGRCHLPQLSPPCNIFIFFGKT